MNLARDIAALSVYPKEAEWLLLPGTRLRIESITVDGLRPGG